jgi:hypothetical protein
MAQFQRAVINLAPQHKFKGLSKWPEAQLMLLMPRVLWNRTRIYVPHFEAVHLAGRFGADPGDFEWEVLTEPQGFKWWRRTVGGDPAYCAFIVAPDVTTDPVEVFGMIDIASDTPWWFDAIDDMVRIEMRGETFARQNNLSEHQGKVFVSLRDEYGPRKLITTAKDDNGIAWRVGAPEEVEKLRKSFVSLVNRARTSTLPDETVKVKTGELKSTTGSLRSPTGSLAKPSTGSLSKPATGSLPTLPKPPTAPLHKPVTNPLPAEPKKPTGSLPPEPPKKTTGSLRDALSNLLKPKTDQLKKDK